MKNKLKIAGSVALVFVLFVLRSPPPTTSPPRHAEQKQKMHGGGTEATRHAEAPISISISDNLAVIASATETQQTHDDDDANGSNQSLVPCKAILSSHQVSNKILRADVTFLHNGKAGGGTIFREQLSEVWRIDVHRCHPTPFKCHQEKKLKEDGSTLNITNENSEKLFLINVRDPVDRFESAFYFTGSMLCNPDPNKETRVRIKKDTQHTVNIDEKTPVWKNKFVGLTDQEIAYQCNDKPTNSRSRMFYTKYKENANLLAEALCSSNVTARMEARHDVHMVGFMRANIDDWMKFLYAWPNIHSDKIFPIVVMPPLAGNKISSSNNNNNLKQQVKQAVEWLHQKLQFESSQNFTLRRRNVQCQQNNDTTVKDAQLPLQTKEASLTYQHSSKSPNHPVLSEKSQACLAVYFLQDFKWLGRIRKELCKTLDCEQAIDAIFQRRAPQLEPHWEKEHSAIYE